MVLYRNKKRYLKYGILISLLLLYMGGCAITINNVNDSTSTNINNEQRASQKNDSTQINNQLKYK